MDGCYCVVYYKGTVLYSICTVSDALRIYTYVLRFGSISGWSAGSESYIISRDLPAVDMFIESLLDKREIHVTQNEGECLLDIYYVSG